MKHLNMTLFSLNHLYYRKYISFKKDTDMVWIVQKSCDETSLCCLQFIKGIEEADLIDTYIDNYTPY